MAAATTSNDDVKARIRLLEEELAREVAQLPASLRSSNPSQLVSYLASVFQEEDFLPLPKSIEEVEDSPPDESAATWKIFQDAYNADVDSPEAKQELELMAAAARKAKAELTFIERTSRPPKDDLGFLPEEMLTGGRSSASPDLVACNACNQTVLACRFAAHLGHCPGSSAKQQSPAPSRTSSLRGSSGGRASSVGRAKVRVRDSRGAPLRKSNLSNGSGSVVRQTPAVVAAARPDAWAPSSEGPVPTRVQPGNFLSDEEAPPLAFLVRNKRSKTERRSRSITLSELPWHAPPAPPVTELPAPLQPHQPASAIRASIPSQARVLQQRPAAVVQAGFPGRGVYGSNVPSPRPRPAAGYGSYQTQNPRGSSATQMAAPHVSAVQMHAAQMTASQQQASQPQLPAGMRYVTAQGAAQRSSSIPTGQRPAVPQRAPASLSSGCHSMAAAPNQIQARNIPQASSQALQQRPGLPQVSQLRPQAAPRTVPLHIERNANRAAMHQQRLSQRPAQHTGWTYQSSREGPKLDVSEFMYPRAQLPASAPQQSMGLGPPQMSHHRPLHSDMRQHVQPFASQSSRAPTARAGQSMSNQMTHPGMTQHLPRPVPQQRAFHLQPASTAGRPSGPVSQAAGPATGYPVTQASQGCQPGQHAQQSGQRQLHSQQASLGFPVHPSGTPMNAAWPPNNQAQHSATQPQPPKTHSAIPGLGAEQDDSLLYSNPVNGYIQNEWTVGLNPAPATEDGEWRGSQAAQGIGEFGPPSRKMGNLYNISHRLPKLPA